MKRKHLFVFFILLFFVGTGINAQKKGVMLDAISQKPIAYINIYTSNNGHVLGTTTNKAGQFEINFPFEKLYVSHVNYGTLELDKAEIKDTIHLIPNDILLTEVTVTGKEPDWIRNILREIIKNKKNLYSTKEHQFEFDYETYTLSESSGYAFNSKGILHMPAMKQNELYTMIPTENTVRYKDNTAGTDFSNMRRMLYEDFITNLDSKFLKQYNFSQNISYKGENKNMVQVLFFSDKFPDDNGYVIIDTLNKVITETWRESGLNYNLQNQTKAVYRNFAASSLGFTYEEWVTQNHAKYKKTGNTYYLSECNYKLHMRSSTENKKVKAKNFYAIESKLRLSDKAFEKTDKDSWIVIPEPVYITIYTKKMREMDERLQKVSKKYENF